MASPHDLNERQLEALKQYKNQMGREWRENLLSDWWSAGARTRFSGDWAYLQQIRNRFGPSWLHALSDAEIEEAATSKAAKENTDTSLNANT